MKADNFSYKDIKLTERIVQEERHILKDFEKCKNKARLAESFKKLIETIKICNEMN